MKRCANCKFWKVLHNNPVKGKLDKMWKQNRGECLIINNDSCETMAFICSEDEGALITNIDFECSLFEEK